MDVVVGQCLTPVPNDVTSFEVVDCAQPHQLEVFALVDDPASPGSRYPGKDLLEREANVACAPEFETYVGVPIERSEFGGTFFLPKESTWQSGQRRLLCAVSAKTGQLTSSVRGSRR